jgi:glycosyltransferase involved in cell wall biosynthesis
MVRIGSTDVPLSKLSPAQREMTSHKRSGPEQLSLRNQGLSDMQIVLLTEAPGGVARHIIDLHHGLLNRGWRSTLILSLRRMDDRYMDEIHSGDKKQVVLLDMKRSPHPSDLSAYLRVRSLLKRVGGWPILHAHSTKAGLLGTLFRSKVSAMVYTPHAYRASDPSLSPLKRRVLRGIEMAYSRSYDRIIAVSPSERDYVLNCGVNPARVTCIPNGIHYDAAKSGALRPRRMPLPTSVTLGFVGRLVHQKNPLLFVETLANLVHRGYESKAIVVGDGELLSEMRTLAAKLNVAGRIDWRGNIAASEVLNDMDIMVHTSRYEALPYTVLEACAALLPVVATDNQGSRSILQGELAENIVAEDSAEQLGDRILKLVSDKVLWERQLDLLDRVAREYSQDRMVVDIEQVYLDLFSASALPKRA